MSDRASIILNYEKMSGVADQLTNLAGRLNNLNRVELEEVLEVLRSSWEGENAELFYSKTVNWQERTDEVSERLLAAADMIKKAANSYKSAELAALDLLEQSTPTGTAASGTTTPT